MRSKRLELLESLNNQRPSTLTKQQEGLKKLKRSTTKPRSASDQREKQVGGLNAVALEKQSSSTTRPHISFINSLRSNEIVTDAVDERLNTVAPEKPSFSTRIVTGQRAKATVKGQRAKEIVTDASVDEISNDVALQKQSLSTTKPRISSVNGQKANEIVTDAVALEKKRSSATKPRSATANVSWADEIQSIAVDPRFKDNALEKQRASTTPPCSAFFSGSRANNILSDPVDERLKAVDDMLDAGRDTGDSDSLDTWSDIRDEDADGNSDMLPTNSDEDADVVETRDEDAELLGSDGNSDVQMVEDRSLPTNSEKVAGSSRKRKHDMVQTQVTDPHSESNYANCPGNGQGSTSRPSDTRRIIKFDVYGRPCGDGSEQFATAIGKAARAHCPPAIESWKKVPDSIKDNIWKALVAKYVVPEVYRPNVLARANNSYKTWKRRLRVEMDKYETISERKLNMPKRHISKREDWESFVDFCNTDEDRKRRADGKKRQEASEFMQSCGRKGIYRKIYNLQKESPTGEVNRSAIFLDTHISKTVNDPESPSISDIKLRLIKDLVEANPDGQNDIDNDAVAQVCGRDRKGIVRGMGGGVSRTKVLASSTVIKTLREVQQENQRLQSDNQILVVEFGENTQNHASRPLNQSASDFPDYTSTPSNQSSSQVSQAPDCSNSLPALSFLAQPRTSNLPPPSCLAPPAFNLPLHSHLAPTASNLTSPTRLAPRTSNLPLRNFPSNSRLTSPASNLHGSSCFIKNFKGRTIALGSFNTFEPPMEHVYSLIIEDIFDRDAELFDKDGKLEDIMIGGVINWPKACVVANLPADSCFIRNFKRRTVAFGTFSASGDPQMEHVYSVVVREIYDRKAELFDTDGKLGDIKVGNVINWPKACIQPCQ